METTEGTTPPPMPKTGRAPFSTPGYESLAHVLALAYDQSARGKGLARHGNGLPFMQQDIIEISKRVGPGGPAFQIEKKVREAIGMIGRKELGSAKAEVLGAIVYSAAMWLIIDHIEKNTESP